MAAKEREVARPAWNMPNRLHVRPIGVALVGGFSGQVRLQEDTYRTVRHPDVNVIPVTLVGDAWAG
jgi:hypothetical protein